MNLLQMLLKTMMMIMMKIWTSAGDMKLSFVVCAALLFLYTSRFLKKFFCNQDYNTSGIMGP